MTTPTIMVFEDEVRPSNIDGTTRVYYSSTRIGPALEAIASASKTLFFGINFRDFTQTSGGPVQFQLELEHTNDGITGGALTVPVVAFAAGVAGTYQGKFKMVPYSESFGNKIRAKLSIKDSNQTPAEVSIAGDVSLSGKPF